MSSVTSSSDTVACTARYDPWGTPVGAQSSSNPCNTGSTSSDRFFNGERRDPVSGEYQLGSRTYDPGKGTFLTPDNYRQRQPAANLGLGTDPLTLNRYSYVNGDPVNLMDPDGHRILLDGDGGGGCGCSQPRPAKHRAASHRTSSHGGGCGWNPLCYASAGWHRVQHLGGALRAHFDSARDELGQQIRRGLAAANGVFQRARRAVGTAIRHFGSNLRDGRDRAGEAFWGGLVFAGTTIGKRLPRGVRDKVYIPVSGPPLFGPNLLRVPADLVGQMEVRDGCG